MKIAFIILFGCLPMGLYSQMHSYPEPAYHERIQESQAVFSLDFDLKDFWLWIHEFFIKKQRSQEPYGAHFYTFINPLDLSGISHGPQALQNGLGMDLEVFNRSGNMIDHRRIYGMHEIHEILYTLDAGVYLFKVYSGNDLYTTRMVKM
ncbi:MAG: T9SS type A sorting domain-containing protein [Saprospiraceae bacterium]|nr:T9SS type A sorting domain-containing protein [Saprospiraceae bacterium]